MHQARSGIGGLWTAAALAGGLLVSERAAAGSQPLVEYLAAGPIVVSEAAAEAVAPGGNLEELLNLARQFSPEMAAAASDAQAADAAVKAAGALQDPELAISFEDVDRNRSGVPQSVGSVLYEIEQRFPWWGKRRLQREVAKADALEARAGARTVQLALEAQLKRAFADAWLASRAIRVTEAIERDLRALSDLAGERYALGLADRGEVAEAEIAIGAARAERATLTAALAAAKAQINALLDRPPDAALADPASLPDLPSDAELNLENLLARAQTDNPSIAQSRASAAAALDNRDLAERSWYPDITLGLAVVERRFDDADGYEARVGINLPLQWGVRRARIEEASARLRAAEHRIRSTERNLAASLAEALSALDAAQQREEILISTHLNQRRAALKAAEAGYPLGRAGLSEVIAARQRLRQIELEHLGEQAEQRRLLAEIERWIGGEL